MTFNRLTIRRQAARRAAVLLAAFTCLVLAAAPAMAEDYVLKTRVAPLNELFEPLGGRPLMQGFLTSMAIEGLPEGVSASKVVVMEQQVVLAVDAEFTRLWIDANGDGLLKDDAPLALAPLKESAWLFAAATIKAGKGEQIRDVSMNLAVTRLGMVAVFPAAIAEGDVEARGRICRTTIVDANLNGRFDDRLVLGEHFPRETNFDLLAMDINEDGTVEPKWSGGETMPLVEMVRVGRGYYGLTVAADGSKVTVAELEPKLSVIRLPVKSLQLALVGPAGAVRIGGEAEARIPAGRYLVVGYTLMTVDAEGQVWLLEGLPCEGSERLITVADDKPPEVALGRNVSISVRSFSHVNEQKQRVWVFAPQVKGDDGELYQPYLRNGERLVVPTVTFRRNGEVLSTQKFEFG